MYIKTLEVCQTLDKDTTDTCGLSDLGHKDATRHLKCVRPLTRIQNRHLKFVRFWTQRYNTTRYLKCVRQGYNRHAKFAQTRI